MRCPKQTRAGTGNKEFFLSGLKIWWTERFSEILVKIRRRDVIWRHFPNFDDVITKSDDVSRNCHQIWLLNIDFRKENLCTFKMRCRPFPYDNWVKNYRFFNLTPIFAKLWRHYDVFLNPIRIANIPWKFHAWGVYTTKVRQGGHFCPPPW